jgi:hypothetical protein
MREMKEFCTYLKDRRAEKDDYIGDKEEERYPVLEEPEREKTICLEMIRDSAREDIKTVNHVLG